MFFEVDHLSKTLAACWMRAIKWLFFSMSSQVIKKIVLFVKCFITANAITFENPNFAVGVRILELVYAEVVCLWDMIFQSCVKVDELSSFEYSDLSSDWNHLSYLLICDILLVIELVGQWLIHEVLLFAFVFSILVGRYVHHLLSAGYQRC